MMTTTTGSRAHARPVPSEPQPQGQGAASEATAAAAITAEAVGTAILVFAIAATVAAAALNQTAKGSAYGTLAIVLVNGIALAAVVAAFGHVSGAHFNPAVTLAMAVNRELRWSLVPGYIIAQMVGGVVGALAAELVYGSRARVASHLAAPAPGAGVSTGQAFAAELLITFVLVIVIMAVATDSRVPQGLAPVAIGAALATAVFIGAPLTGAGVNPARALGPMIAAGTFTDWWLYLIAPIIGGLLAGALYRGLLSKTRQAA